MTQLLPIPNEDIPAPAYGAPRRNGTKPGRVPPHDLDAEAHFLGACLMPRTAGGVAKTPAELATRETKPSLAIDAGIAHELTCGDFYRPAHGHIWQAITTLTAASVAPDPVIVAAQLERDHLLDDAGGRSFLTDLQLNANTANAHVYARIVADHARRRRLISIAADLADLGYEPANDIEDVETKALELVQHAATPRIEVRSRLVNGATFLLDGPTEITSVWGSGDTVLWPEGEAAMIVGPSGIGKTTIAQQVVLGRIGIRNEVLGQPVNEGSRRVLYLAMDRPMQAKRSMQRMVAEHDREILEDLIMFWQGPPPFNVVEDPRALARFCEDQSADTVVIDSMKDICHKLNDDEHASKTNAAMQECIARGIEVISLHHQRKQGSTTKKIEPPKTLDEVYGNTWLVAGQGSVILVWGQAGDPIVELTHLKPPAIPVGPWTLTMDFDAGITTLDDEISPLKIVAGAHRGATANFVARVMFRTEEPTRNDTEKARRKLDRLFDQGLVHRSESPTEGGGKPTTLYYPIDTRRTP